VANVEMLGKCWNQIFLLDQGNFIIIIIIIITNVVITVSIIQRSVIASERIIVISESGTTGTSSKP
jgi:hypothetical protein